MRRERQSARLGCLLSFLLALYSLWVPSSLAQPAVGTTLVVITGIGGEARFTERFHTWAATLMDAASDRYGFPEDRIVYLAADPERDPDRTRARSSREQVQAVLRDLASTMPDDAPLFVVVLGHGSFRDGVSKVNLPGPDMTAEDFAQALAAFGERPIVFANLTSASGGVLSHLSAPGRVVITSTRSGTERNASQFAQYFVAAFVGADADADKDERLSVLEAFRYARTEVGRAYDREQKLLTEHAVLDDNGDGRGSVDPAPDGEDGRLAATLTLQGTARKGPAGEVSDPELARLYDRKASLEQKVAELRQRKSSLEREAYENKLEEILIELALVNRAIREAEG
ncbi:MAG: hypothetical protein AAF657_13615 [Acidobacteriota bacterium]